MATDLTSSLKHTEELHCKQEHTIKRGKHGVKLHAKEDVESLDNNNKAHANTTTK